MGGHSIDATTSIKALLAIASAWTANQTFNDNVLVRLGTDGDSVFKHTSAVVAADAEPDANVYVGTSDHQGTAANSLVLSNITASGDIQVLINKGGNSLEALLVDASVASLSLGFGLGYVQLCPLLNFVNDSANTEMTIGLTLNQGASDNEILAFKSSDVAHGITSLGETDTYGKFFKQSSTTGGMVVRGLGSATSGLEISGGAVTDTTTKATTSAAYIEAYVGKKSGTTLGDAGTNANMIAFKNWGTGARVIIDAEGDIHAAGDFVAGLGDGNATAVTGTNVRAPHMIGGTTVDAAGADLTLAAGQGTGIGDVGQVIFSLPVIGVTGSVVQTLATRLTLDMAGGTALYVGSAGTGASGMILKNMKNAAASALSGTQLDVEIDIGGTPYYFTVYPTKA